MLALSVRQPFAELIISGQKQQENRSLATRVRGQVYVYASKKISLRVVPTQYDFRTTDLPTGYIVGTIEIHECVQTDSGYAWLLRSPMRFSQLLRPTKRPQPIWFYPF
jgi:hypothetical protein